MLSSYKMAVMSSVTSLRKRNLVSVGSYWLRLSIAYFKTLFIITSYYLISTLLFVARLDIILKMVC